MAFGYGLFLFGSFFAFLLICAGLSRSEEEREEIRYQRFKEMKRFEERYNKEKENE